MLIFNQLRNYVPPPAQARVFNINLTRFKLFNIDEFFYSPFTPLKKGGGNKKKYIDISWAVQKVVVECVQGGGDIYRCIFLF